MLKAVIDSYYPDAARSGNAARVRAQAAQSVASLFATGLVAALTLSDFAQQPLAIKVAGSLAVAAWSTAALLYIRAVGLPVPVDDRAGGSDPDRLVRVILDRAKVERDAVDRQQRIANSVAAAALLLTSLTFILAAFVPQDDPIAPIVFVPNDEQLSILKHECGPLRAGEALRAELRESSLRAELLEIRVPCKAAIVRLIVRRTDLKGLIILD